MNKPAVTVNGTQYRWPDKPLVVVCIDGGDPAYFRQFLGDGAIPNIARFVRAGLQRDRRRHHAELHLPEQHVDHHRDAGLEARHLGQLLPRYGDRQADRDDRPGAAARRHDSFPFCECRRAGHFDHGEGQAEKAARKEPRPVERQHQLLLRIRIEGDAAGERHRQRPRADRHGAARHVLDGAVAVRAGSGHQAAGEQAPRSHVSLAHRLGAAQVRARGVGSEALLPRARRALRPPRRTSAPRWR